ncbi:MAG: cytochrome c biogenesis protein CcsA [Candidatus Marinimicrobia bacterium]|nr:cytochrome c biogenesis protein CcsA [Candidatus Neomarinimicrobiota bacterium]
MEIILILILAALYGFSFLSGLFKKQQAALYAVYAGFILHLGLVIFRSVSAQHPPFTNIYETLILLSWLMLAKFLFLQESRSALVINLQRAVIFLLILVPLSFPAEMRAVQPVMPALKSAWMYIHVPAYLFGYVALFSAVILAVIRLFVKEENFVHCAQLELDTRLSLLFLSTGLVAGAIWAQVSWGNYWSWDPKETWALINILILSLYFIARSSKLRSIILIITFLSVMFTYFGVTWLLPGLHSY